MQITELPFNKLIGLELAGSQHNDMVTLPAGDQYLNHVGTVHASALLAVAEAGSGELLIRLFKHRSDVLPVLRNLEAKFRKPAKGRVTSRCEVPVETVAAWEAELDKRGRALMQIPVEVIDAEGVPVLSAVAEWFAAKKT